MHFLAPFGNRAWKKSTDSSGSIERKYVVDIAAKLPTILLDIDGSTSSLKKTYIYVADPPALGRADRQIIAQHACPLGDGGSSADKYFYLHDRLGSVRLVIGDDLGAVVKPYTYEPFGRVIDTGSVCNKLHTPRL